MKIIIKTYSNCTLLHPFEVGIEIHTLVTEHSSCFNFGLQ